ncbi:MAG: FAD-dependent monooxygenase, partial [Rhodospirillaceae bacterium]|nr:FAD-dependent monooxygenase [Rhodospirillaceae bacterium]
MNCSSWTRGRAAILGDSAHGMAPNLGQGAGVAIVNATVLARAVSQTEDVPAALKRWESAERAYVDRTQTMSHLDGVVGTRWPHKLLSLRSRILPYLARTDLLQRNLRVAVDHVP